MGSKCAAETRFRNSRLTRCGFGLVCLALLLAGCSLVQLAYSNASWLAERAAGRYVAMSRAQRASFRESFESAQERHRREALPDTVALLRSLESRLSHGGLDHDQASCLLWTGGQLYRDLAARAVPVAGELLASLQPRQVERLDRALAESRREFAERYLQQTREGRAQARAERALARLEDWLGELRPDQEELLRQASLTLPDTSPAWNAYRERQQHALVALLRARAPRSQIDAYLDAWWVRREGLDSAYQAAFARVVQGAADLLVALERSLDAQQRGHLRARLGKLADGLAQAAAGNDGGALLPLADHELVCPPGVPALAP